MRNTRILSGVRGPARYDVQSTSPTENISHREYLPQMFMESVCHKKANFKNSRYDPLIVRQKIFRKIFTIVAPIKQKLTSVMLQYRNHFHCILYYNLIRCQ